MVLSELFYNGVLYANVFRKKHEWSVLLLPFAGIIIVYMYQKLAEGKGTDDIIDSVHDSAPVRFRLGLAIL